MQFECLNLSARIEREELEIDQWCEQAVSDPLLELQLRSLASNLISVVGSSRISAEESKRAEIVLQAVTHFGACIETRRQRLKLEELRD